MKKKIITLLTVCFILFGSISVPMVAEAEDYLGYNPMVVGYQVAVIYNPTFQTNQMSGCVRGFAVISDKDQFVRDIGGFTHDELWSGAEPVLYVGDYFGESAERTLATETATKLGGGLICMLEIRMFKYTGTWNQPIDEVANNLTLVAGLPDEANGTLLWENSEFWDFAVLRIEDGKATILKDIDTDPITLMFETNKSGYYALIHAPKGNIDAYLAQNTSTGNKDEYDKVPKMGDTFFDSFVTFGQGRRR